jgi:hypothetical protein
MMMSRRSDLLTPCFAAFGEWKMLSYASDAGFGGSKFPSKCNGIVDAIPIVLMMNCIVFDGFTPFA